MEKRVSAFKKTYSHGRMFLAKSAAGVSGSAVVLSAHILPKLAKGEWKRVLFVPTGALLNKTSFNEGQNVPGIAHGIVIEALKNE